MKYLEIRFTNGSTINLNDEELINTTVDKLASSLYHDYTRGDYLRVPYQIEFRDKTETRTLYIRKERLMTFEVYTKE